MEGAGSTKFGICQCQTRNSHRREHGGAERHRHGDAGRERRAAVPGLERVGGTRAHAGASPMAR